MPGPAAYQFVVVPTTTLYAAALSARSCSRTPLCPSASSGTVSSRLAKLPSDDDFAVVCPVAFVHDTPLSRL